VEVVTARAAVLLRERQAEQAELAHLPRDLRRELITLVELADLRGDDLLRELPHGLAQCLGLGVQPVVQHPGHSSC
jgi:hypothetical protein